MKETQNPGKTPRTKSQHRRLTIGLLAHSTPVDFDNLWIGMVETAREQGVNLSYFVGGMLHSPFGFEPQANVIYDLVGPENVNGLIITGILAHYTSPEAMKQFCERYAPLPMVTQEIPVSGIPSILIDFYQGMYNVLIHLIEIHGYHRIAYIRGPKEALTAEERYRAYADVLNKYDIPLNMNLVTPGTFFAPSGEEAVHLLFDERKLQPGRDIEAIVAVNDYTALDALKALHARGIRVPDEVAIVGFDDIEQSRSVTPPLTTVQIPSYEEGRPLVESLLARLDGKEVPDQVKLPTKLIIRESCGCVDPVHLLPIF